MYWNELLFTDAWRDKARMMADANAQGARVYTAKPLPVPRGELSIGTARMVFPGMPVWRDVFLYTTWKQRLQGMTDPTVREALRRDETDLPEFIQYPYSITGLSDAGAHMAGFCVADYSTTFLQHWCRDKGDLTLEEGVRRLTFMPAHLIGLRDRGLIQDGMVADLLVFNPKTIGPCFGETVEDIPGGGSRMIKRAQGIDCVIVNGEILLEGGEHTGALPGKVLRSTAYQGT